MIRVDARIRKRSVTKIRVTRVFKLRLAARAAAVGLSLSDWWRGAADKAVLRQLVRRQLKPLAGVGTTGTPRTTEAKDCMVSLRLPARAKAGFQAAATSCDQEFSQWMIDAAERQLSRRIGATPRVRLKNQLRTTRAGGKGQYRLVAHAVAAEYAKLPPHLYAGDPNCFAAQVRAACCEETSSALRREWAFGIFGQELPARRRQQLVEEIRKAIRITPDAPVGGLVNTNEAHHPWPDPNGRRAATYVAEELLPRAGFDRVIFSAARPGLGFLYNQGPGTLPKAIGLHRRVADQRLEGGIYARRALYQSDLAHLPTIEIFHRPRRPYLPHLQIRLLATMHRLLQPAGVEAMERTIAQELRATLVIAEVELTADFPPRPDFERLRAALYVPSALAAEHWELDGHRCDTITGAGGTCFLGRNRRTIVRAYRKVEAGLVADRIEFVFKRPCLRRLEVHQAKDLSALRWGEALTRRVRFLEYAPRKGLRIGGLFAADYAALIRISGFHNTLRTLARRAAKTIRHQASAAAFATELRELIDRCVCDHPGSSGRKT